MGTNSVTADSKALVVRFATVAQFADPVKPGQNICLVFHRRVEGKLQCALLHRRNTRTSVAAEFSELATHLHQACFPAQNPSTIEWWEITVALDCDGATRFGVDAVDMSFADERYTGATKVEADDAQFLAWTAYVEPAVRLGVEIHIL